MDVFTTGIRYQSTVYIISNIREIISTVMVIISTVIVIVSTVVVIEISTGPYNWEFADIRINQTIQ